MNAEKARASFKKRFGPEIKNARVEKRVHQARKKFTFCRLWFDVGAGNIKEAVRHLCDIHPDPHFAVCSGYENGDMIDITYHFTLNYGRGLDEFAVSMRVSVPKARPVLPTITGLVPGALVSEREIQEMLGVKVRGIPDPRRLFLHKEFPEGVHPWRRDKTGAKRLVRNLNGGETA